jgi:hypothetical protein
LDLFNLGAALADASLSVEIRETGTARGSAKPWTRLSEGAKEHCLKDMGCELCNRSDVHAAHAGMRNDEFDSDGLASGKRSDVERFVVDAADNETECL